MIHFPDGAKKALNEAYGRGRLTLYLGAGVSVPSGLPTWQRLVLAMYLDMLSETNRRAYANYLHAVAEWMLETSPDPLEITAQKLRIHFGSDEAGFIDALKRQLYAGFFADEQYHVPDRRKLRRGNDTLRAVSRLIEGSSVRKARGVEAVVTYNYDNLLELALTARTRFHVVDRADSERGPGIPIYHVHGYVPLGEGEASGQSAIIFTEEQYHEATNEAYSWTNLVQLHGFSGSTGLMVGLSLSDRNIRRLLHALSGSPVPATCYAVLQRPTWKQPYDHEEAEIDRRAKTLYERAKESGSPVPPNYGIKGPHWRDQIGRILDRAQDVATEQQEWVLRDLGVTPIWYDEHEEVPDVLEEIGTR